MKGRQRVGAVLLGACAACAGAQEIAPFRLIGIDGNVSLRYLRDGYVTQAPSAGAAPEARSRQTVSDLRTEVFVMTRSYVYHPNFLLLDLGAGPILQGNRLVDGAGESRVGSALYNLSGRATFLRDKPYRGSVFYEHLNPTLSFGLGQAMSQESERLGFDIALLEPFTPVPIAIDAARSQTSGRGADRIVDDRINRVNLRASRSFGALGMTRLSYQVADQDSRSGSPSLPIQASSSSIRNLSLDTRLRLGTNGGISLVNLVSWNAQGFRLESGSVPERRDARLLLDLIATHGAALQSFGTLDASSSDQGALTSRVRTAIAGIRYAPTPQLSTAFSARAEGSRTSQSDSRSRGADGTVRYERRLAVGTLQASYGARYEHRDQQGSAPQTRVIGERVTLAGTAHVALAQPRAIAGSVTVSNETRTQVFVEGLDYLLTVVGLDTRVQRLVGGNITDGQNVLLDYVYDVGGTYAFNQLNQTISVNWSPVRHASVYFRAFEATPHLESGAPTFPLNAVRSRTVGARVDVPLRGGLEAVLGGSIEHEDRRETVAPQRRVVADLYAQFDDPITGVGSLRVSGRRSQVLYDQPGQNVDLRGIDLRYAARHPLGIEISGDLSFERDTGGTVPRRRSSGTLRSQWRYRQATLSAELVHVKEVQGGFDRAHSVLQLVFRRDF